eukprot:gnl/MRDRNA2_/MRDRNA2_234974_c0_seq1.p1 gnl/MRDRNA2_/MRDRNA2_234974_c0~~gnl/MRDRNA2_/MRDRNA2_234974_c0_seq1.p1  ORF type:complete len:601 (+),score=121.16 gnl/MRDRNA2_/MRDRNA2_234974_c0_seq1:269-1804(+)
MPFTHSALMSRLEAAKLAVLPATIEITLNTAAGSTVEVVVDSSSTVLDVKQKVFEKAEVPPLGQRLVFEANILQNEERIGLYYQNDAIPLLLIVTFEDIYNRLLHNVHGQKYESWREAAQALSAISRNDLESSVARFCCSVPLAGYGPLRGGAGRDQIITVKTMLSVTQDDTKHLKKDQSNSIIRYLSRRSGRYRPITPREGKADDCAVVDFLGILAADGDEVAADSMWNVLKGLTEKDIRERALQVLSKLGDGQVACHLIDYVVGRGLDRGHKMQALETLSWLVPQDGKCKAPIDVLQDFDQQNIGALIRFLLQQSDVQTARRAADLIAQLVPEGDEHTIGVLIEAASSTGAPVSQCINCTKALVRFSPKGREDVINVLQGMCAEDRPLPIRMAAMESLTKLAPVGHDGVLDALVQGMKSPDITEDQKKMLHKGVEKLAPRGHPCLLKMVGIGLLDPDVAIRIMALKMIVQLAESSQVTDEIVTAVQACSQADWPSARCQAQKTLAKLVK